MGSAFTKMAQLDMKKHLDESGSSPQATAHKKESDPPRSGPPPALTNKDCVE